MTSFSEIAQKLSLSDIKEKHNKFNNLSIYFALFFSLIFGLITYIVMSSIITNKFSDLVDMGHYFSIFCGACNAVMSYYVIKHFSFNLFQLIPKLNKEAEDHKKFVENIGSTINDNMMTKINESIYNIRNKFVNDLEMNHHLSISQQALNIHYSNQNRFQFMLEMVSLNDYLIKRKRIT